MPEVINLLDAPVAERVEIFDTRYYRLDPQGELYPSVTTVLDRPMGPDLCDWHARMASRRTIELMEGTALPLMAGEKRDMIRDIVKDSEGAADRETQLHAIVGELFHEFMWTAELDNMLIEALPSRWRKMVDTLMFNWTRILSRWKVFPLLAELMMANPVYGYGGTLDALLQDEDGFRIALEVKTSRSLSYSHPMQASAYAMNLDYLGIGYDKIAVLRVDKYQDAVFDYKFVNKEKSFAKFLSCLDTYKVGDEVWEELDL